MTEWRIEKLVPGGDGMARLEDGRIGFARGVVPGDVIRPTRTLAKKGYVRAEAWSLVRPGADRVEPPCPIADRCGGCDWMALERSAQVRNKAAILREALERMGRLSGLPKEIPIVTAGPDLAYRSRVKFHFDAERRLGFFAKGSHDLVDVERCPICRPDVERALAALRALPRQALVPFSAVEIRSALEGARVAVHFELRPGARVPPETRAAVGDLSREFSVTMTGDSQRADDTDRRFSLPGGVRARAPAGVFTQVNVDVNALLVGAVVDGARARNLTRFCDLFAGAGNFALALLRAGMSGTAVERDARAVDAARRAAEEAGLDARTFVADDAEHFLSSRRSLPTFDLVVVDPPRRGAKEILAHVVRLSPRHVAMVSCDPVTLARDLATLTASGYDLGDVCGFDMFPHTHHLESLAWLSRGAGARDP